MLGGVLVDVVPRVPLLGLATLGITASAAVVPACRSLAAMIATKLVGAVFCGVLDTGNSICPTICLFLAVHFPFRYYHYFFMPL